MVVETEDDAHTARVVESVRRLEGVLVLDVVDRVFARHQGGKIGMKSRVDVRGIVDPRQIYTPGVARVARAIEREPERAWELTSIGRTVGIFTNGTRVLGLGDVGPLASLPVMEGKAVLYDVLAGLSAVPILLETTDPGRARRGGRPDGALVPAPSTSEDIRVARVLRHRAPSSKAQRLQKPVMHDDQHGTAVAALAAILSACRMTGVDPRASRLAPPGQIVPDPLDPRVCAGVTASTVRVARELGLAGTARA